MSSLCCCLQEAAIAPKAARTIGIAVDHRRKNRSLESLQVGQIHVSVYSTTLAGDVALLIMDTSFGQENANRLKAYKSKLVVFPRRSKKPKQGDSSAEELQTVQQHKGRHVLPIVHEKPEPELVDIPADLKVELRFSFLVLF